MGGGLRVELVLSASLLPQSHLESFSKRDSVILLCNSTQIKTRLL